MCTYMCVQRARLFCVCVFVCACKGYQSSRQLYGIAARSVCANPAVRRVGSENTHMPVEQAEPSVRLIACMQRTAHLRVCLIVCLCVRARESVRACNYKCFSHDFGCIACAPTRPITDPPKRRTTRHACIISVWRRIYTTNCSIIKSCCLCASVYVFACVFVCVLCSVAVGWHANEVHLIYAFIQCALCRSHWMHVANGSDEINVPAD